MRTSGLVVFALALTVGCGGKAPPAETTPEAKPAPAADPAPAAVSESGASAPWTPTPSPRPASVLALAVVPSPLATAQAALRFTERAKLPVPVTAETVGPMVRAALEQEGMAGVRIDAPAYVLVAHAPAAEMPIAVVFAASDPAVVEAGAARTEQGLEVRAGDGYVVVGEPPVLNLVADYALTNLRSEPLPVHPTITAFGANLRSAYAMQLAMGRAFLGTMKESEDPEEVLGAGILELYLELAEQIETISFSLEVAPEMVSLVYGLAGAPGTTVAAFCQAQKPSDFGELALLPDTKGAFVAAGRVDWSPLTDSMTEIAKLMTQVDAGMSVDFARLFEAIDDEFAMSVAWDGGLAMAMSMRTDQAAEAQKSMVAWWEDLASSPMFDKKKTRLRTRRVRGKVVTEIEYAMAKMPPDPELAEVMDIMLGKPPYRGAMVALPGRIAIASLSGARKRIGALIAAAGGKTPGTPMPAWVELARSRGESFADVFDFSAIAAAVGREGKKRGDEKAVEFASKVPAGVHLYQGASFSERAMSYRTSVPVEVAEVIGRFVMEMNKDE